jgi:hypothetical protein
MYLPRHSHDPLEHSSITKQPIALRAPMNDLRIQAHNMVVMHTRPDARHHHGSTNRAHSTFKVLEHLAFLHGCRRFTSRSFNAFRDPLHGKQIPESGCAHTEDVHGGEDKVFLVRASIFGTLESKRNQECGPDESTEKLETARCDINASLSFETWEVSRADRDVEIEGEDVEGAKGDTYAATLKDAQLDRSNARDERIAGISVADAWKLAIGHAWLNEEPDLEVNEHGAPDGEGYECWSGKKHTNPDAWDLCLTYRWRSWESEGRLVRQCEFVERFARISHVGWWSRC